MHRIAIEEWTNASLLVVAHGVGCSVMQACGVKVDKPKEQVYAAGKKKKGH